MRFAKLLTAGCLLLVLALIPAFADASAENNFKRHLLQGNNGNSGNNGNNGNSDFGQSNGNANGNANGNGNGNSPTSAPVTAAPVTSAPVTAPPTEPPTTEPPTTEPPTTEPPTTEPPTTEPPTEPPTTEPPTTEPPTTEPPTTEPPTTEPPTTEPPTTEPPTTEPPTTEPPTTEPPTTEPPVAATEPPVAATEPPVAAAPPPSPPPPPDKPEPSPCPADANCTDVSIFDGYYSYCPVFVDIDEDGRWSENEPISVSDAYGQVHIESTSESIDSATLIMDPELLWAVKERGLVDGVNAELCIDAFTGARPVGRLTAPAGSTVVNPLTTLVVALAEEGGLQMEDAEWSVKSSLGIPLDVDVGHYDAIRGVVSGDAASTGDAATAAKTLAALTSVNNVVANIGGLLAGSGDDDSAAATQEAAKQAFLSVARATVPDDPTATQYVPRRVDLGSAEEVVRAARDAFASAGGEPADEELLATVGAIASELNRKISESAASSEGLQLLEEVSGAGRVAQVEVAGQVRAVSRSASDSRRAGGEVGLADAAAADELRSLASPGGVDVLLDDASSNVLVVLPPSPPGSQVTVVVNIDNSPDSQGMLFAGMAGAAALLAALGCAGLAYRRRRACSRGCDKDFDGVVDYVPEIVVDNGKGGLGGGASLGVPATAPSTVPMVVAP